MNGSLTSRVIDDMATVPYHKPSTGMVQPLPKMAWKKWTYHFTAIWFSFATPPLVLGIVLYRLHQFWRAAPIICLLVGYRLTPRPFRLVSSSKYGSLEVVLILIILVVKDRDAFSSIPVNRGGWWAGSKLYAHDYKYVNGGARATLSLPFLEPIHHHLPSQRCFASQRYFETPVYNPFRGFRSLPRASAL